MKPDEKKTKRKKNKDVDLINMYGSLPMRDLDEWISGLDSDDKEKLKKYIKEKHPNLEENSDQFTFY